MPDPICAIQYSLLNQDHFIKDCWNFWLLVNLKRKCFNEITENVAHGKSKEHSGRKNNSFGLHCWESNKQLHSSGPVDRYSSLRYEETSARAGWRRILFIFKTPDTGKISINKAIQFKKGCRLNDKALGLRAFEIPANAFDHLFVWQSKVSAKSCALMFSRRTVKDHVIVNQITQSIVTHPELCRFDLGFTLPEQQWPHNRPEYWIR